ncbi:MAG TPA: type II toxin-antitoxin system VapC family toxin [Thermoflexales bacterium]|nr:type II toxin-antitoxin system VapC family toxin [Thermoflexales bacterium]
MISALDSNVLIDIFADDTRYASASLAAVRAAGRDGSLVVCEIVLAEIARYFDTLDQLTRMLDRLGVAREPIGEAGCFLAGGGERDRVLADFLIAAHAQTRCAQLISRDRGYYRTYFPELKLIDPTEG